MPMLSPKRLRRHRSRPAIWRYLSGNCLKRRIGSTLNSVNRRLHVALGPHGSQTLVDEALHRLEIERVSQVRDSWSLVKRTEPSLLDQSLPPWLLTIDQVRQGPIVDWTVVANADIW